MAREKAFVKISGDLFQRRDVIQWIKELAKKYHVVLCVGGGTRISEEFEEGGFPRGNFGPLGRELPDLWSRQVARNVLEENQALLGDLIAEEKFFAEIEIPQIKAGSVLCPMNGDVMVEAVYHGFEKIFILTYTERVTKKRRKYGRRKLKKIRVVGFPRLPDSKGM